MKEKIIKLLEENTQVRQLTCGEMLELIDRDDFEEIAQEIVKLFAIPVVRLSCFKEILDMYNAIGDDSDFYKWLYDKVHEA